MDIFDQKKVLSSFSIIVDTREQDTDRARKRYASFGVPFSRSAISYGDYAYNAILPSGNPIYDTSKTIEPLCVVERKMSLDELAGCLGKSRERFQREFMRANERGAKVFMICENASWENLLSGKYKSRLHPNSFAGSLLAWENRYNIGIHFCKAETSGRLIKELLYRDLKERLERGEFDEE